MYDVCCCVGIWLESGRGGCMGTERERGRSCEGEGNVGRGRNVTGVLLGQGEGNKRNGDDMDLIPVSTDPLPPTNERFSYSWSRPSRAGVCSGVKYFFSTSRSQNVCAEGFYPRACQTSSSAFPVSMYCNQRRRCNPSSLEPEVHHR